MDTRNESVTTPTKKVQAPQHTVPSPHRHGPYTATEEKGVEHTTPEKLRHQIMMGHTSAHCWETWQHDIGFQLNGVYYRDKLAMQPRKVLLDELWQAQPWNVTMGDGVTIPRNAGRMLLPIADSVRSLAPGETAIWTLLAFTGGKEDAVNESGTQLPWTGNQVEHIKQIDAVLERITTSPPVSIWVVFRTRQGPTQSPMVCLQLDGRHQVRVARKRAAYVIYDKSRHFYTATAKFLKELLPIQGKAPYQFAILLKSSSMWTPLLRIPGAFVRNKAAVHARVKEEPTMMWRILLPAQYRTENSFYRYMNDVGDVGTSTAVRQSKLPWSGVRRVASPDKESFLWEWTLPESFRCTLQEALYRTREERHEENGTELTMETVPYQHIELTHHQEIYVVLQAKAKQGETLSLIEGPGDLETELGVSLVDEYEIPTNTLLIHIPDTFPQGVPHVRYQRLVTIHPG